jgi:O-antigen ligase
VKLSKRNTLTLPEVALWLYTLFFISMCFSLYIISSITIGLIIIAGLVNNWMETKTFFNPRLKNPFLYGCLSIFILYFIALLYSNLSQEGWSDIQVKTGLIFSPATVCSTSFINSTEKKKLSVNLIFIVVIASLYCAGTAAWRYFQSGDSSFFFYHTLVHPVNGHAIYFSVLVFIALLFSIELLVKSNFILSKSFHLACIVFLSFFLFLLSSKLVITFYFLYLIVCFTSLIKKKPSRRKLIITLLILFIAVSIISLTTSNPVSRRFVDIMGGNLQVLKMEKFNPGMYFNGVQFRLLEWRFTSEILNENHGWMTGVGPANAQDLLNKKYISLDMYVGEPSHGNHGFLGYNTHNQFLGTVLKTGVFGLMALLFTCFTLIKMAWQKKKRLISFIVILLITWLFTESVLERQYGIIIFTFFPLFLWSEQKQPV